jgi:hypothetical protein
MKSDFPEIRTKHLNEYARDAHEISRLTLARLYQRAQATHGAETSFGIVFADVVALREEIRKLGGGAMPVEVLVNGRILHAALVVSGLALYEIRMLASKYGAVLWSVVSSGARNLVTYTPEGKILVKEFPRTLDHGLMFDPQVVIGALSDALGMYVSFQYVPLTFFEKFILWRYRKTIKEARDTNGFDDGQKVERQG